MFEFLAWFWGGTAPTPSTTLDQPYINSYSNLITGKSYSVVECLTTSRIVTVINQSSITTVTSSSKEI